MDRVTRYDEYMSCSMQLKTFFLQNGKKRKCLDCWNISFNIPWNSFLILIWGEITKYEQLISLIGENISFVWAESLTNNDYDVCPGECQYLSLVLVGERGLSVIIRGLTLLRPAPEHSLTSATRDLRLLSLSLSLSFSLSLLSPLSCKQQKIQYTENSAQDEFTHTPYSLLNSEHVKKRESFITPGGAATAAEEIFEMTIVETRHCTVFVRDNSLDKSFTILKTSNIPYLIICLIFVYNI